MNVGLYSIQNVLEAYGQRVGRSNRRLLEPLIQEKPVLGTRDKVTISEEARQRLAAGGGGPRKAAGRT
ncbi:hypothetical protein G3N55_05185 [Dissulfurirhabdus thermomarina]|uniref:Uncharacterized protein n=1 Tax=Dissulfurirhabdus thermomarina TaxID=1765737 RepID=A0A6N9TUQ4_DISTH|nr:hypothetical protein [Dissulfurirhabdus thermomarina]NDY42236.1 hypothetical protein [Dissulfurirhabdus thermomarina]NMX23162.1 hypothetical protein [Dissulfurirhabdus thermomarina]